MVRAESSVKHTVTTGVEKKVSDEEFGFSNGTDTVNDTDCRTGILKADVWNVSPSSERIEEDTGNAFWLLLTAGSIPLAVQIDMFNEIPQFSYRVHFYRYRSTISIGFLSSKTL